MVSTNSVVLSDSSLNTMNECVMLFRKNIATSREWSSIHNAVTLSATLIDVMKAPLHNQDILYTGVLRRFYNETVEFIMTGKRTTNIVVWEGIVNDITGFKPDNMVGNSGSIGAKLLGYESKPQGSKVTSDSLKDCGIRSELLSYAHRDILHRWMLQPNGIDDMLFSLVLMVKIYTVYTNSSQQG